MDAIISMRWDGDSVAEVLAEVFRRYVSAGSHADQSRGGPVPAVVALMLGAVLLVVVVTVILLQVL